MKDLDKPTVGPVHLQLFRPSVIRGPWLRVLTLFSSRSPEITSPAGLVSSRIVFKLGCCISVAATLVGTKEFLKPVGTEFWSTEDFGEFDTKP